MVGGTVKSDPGFAPAFNGELLGQGSDYIHMDPDEKRLRLDARGVVKWVSPLSTISTTYADARWLFD